MECLIWRPVSVSFGFGGSGLGVRFEKHFCESGVLLMENMDGLLGDGGVEVEAGAEIVFGFTGIGV